MMCGGVREEEEGRGRVLLAGTGHLSHCGCETESTGGSPLAKRGCGREAYEGFRVA